MRSRSACSVVFFLAGALSLASRPARAGDDKQACNAAYEATQRLKREGKLQAAKQQAAICVQTACPSFMRSECGSWDAQIDQSQPTVVLQAKDASGNDLIAVQVSLDGAPWVDKLDGKARPVDPGVHTLRFVSAGLPAVQQQVEIREGEKNRLLSASLSSAPVVATPPNTTAPLATAQPLAPVPPPPRSGSRSVGPYIVGGVGVAGLVVFGVAGALTAANASSSHPGCDNTTDTCATTDAAATANSASKRTNTLGSVATAGLVVGLAGVGAATIWFLASSPSKSSAANVGLGLRAGPSESGVQMRASW